MSRPSSQSSSVSQPNSVRLGILAALAVSIVTLIPQISLCISRGSEWQGAYTFVDPDELAYSSYLNTVIKGGPRNYNPDLQKESSIDPNRNETIFSIQFLPPAVLAPLARITGVSASTVFVLLVPIFAFASSIALYWLLFEVTGHAKTSAVGVMIVLLCGTLASVNPITTENTYAVFSFLRRYIPAVPFPVFLLFLTCIWCAFKHQGRRGIWWAAGAGVAFSALVFSYFFLWTTAAAWFFCFTLVWLVARPVERRHVIKCAVVCGGLMIAALVPFFRLLSLRSPTTDHDQVLVLTRAPDLFRITEILGFLLLCAVAYGVHRRIVRWADPAILLIVSIAILPFIVLNQQIITGRSLQPFHYEQFTLNYLILIGIVVIDRQLWGLLLKRPAFSVVLILIIGTVLAVKASREYLAQNITRDEAIPVFNRIEERRVGESTSGAALFDATLLAASAPASCSVPVLWSPYTYTYGTITPAEDNERLFQYFYFLGVDEHNFERIITNGLLYQAALFGLHRVNSALTRDFKPITREEIEGQVRSYAEYRRGFTKEHAQRWPLSFVILSDELVYDLSNLDRWYSRDTGERFKGSLLYRVVIRPQ